MGLTFGLQGTRLAAATALGALLAALAAAPDALGQELSLNGFGDLNYGYRFGDPVDDEAATSFDTFGEEPALKSTHSGFGLVGTDLVLTAELPDDIVYLGEVNFQVMRGNQSEFEVDVERMFLEKRFTQAFNLQGGLFFTPIGYFNRTLYSRAFLMVSAQVPDLFEEELGIVPTHTVGLNAHGQFDLGRDYRLGYAVSIGNGRAADPVANVYARDDDGWRSATAMLEWMTPWGREFRVGLSGWADRISSYQILQPGEERDIRDPTTRPIRLREFGADLHLVLKSQWVNLILEGLYQRHNDIDGDDLARVPDTHVWGCFAELSLNVGEEGVFKPYLRYDGISLPSAGGPYLWLRRDGDVIGSVYVPETNLGMLGLSWDAALSWRMKLEYSAAFSGPRERHGIMAQSAFAF
jgi:hypothetical protein